jgi:hypothetical protein
MARKKQKVSAEFVLIDVLYEDGTRSSNRKVPSSEMDEPNWENAVRALIEAQDREIAELSGRPRGKVKSVTRSPTR